MRFARHLIPREDSVFSLCVAAVLLLIAVSFAAGCGYPKPDLAKVPRGQYSRTVHLGSTSCQAWLPLIVRTDIGGEALELALQAAQPWADALGFAVAVPALEGEDATVTITAEACPAAFVTKEAPYCSRLAQTSQSCDGSLYRQHIELFVPGDNVQTFYVLMHELGHALGSLGGQGHSDDASSIMYRSINAPELLSGPAGPEASFKASGSPAQWVRAADSDSLRVTWGLK